VTEKKSGLGFAVGDTVKVKEGVMFGISEVKVLEISADDRTVTCSAFMFGRETVIELDAADLSPM
ncbi:MAG: transcription termination/antitermination protein NusG, partial [Clostridia bacterium]|nr:transcription termination/antitermination protein NusG [Clostridia bacterium]